MRVRVAVTAGVLVALTTLAMLVGVSPAMAITFTPQECVECHATLSPGIVAQFEAGAMSAEGVTCVDCHGDDHGAIVDAHGAVAASVCQGCHPDQYAEFAHKDAGGAYTNKHALGWTKMTAAARYIVMPAEQRYAMCERCHNIGIVSADGSVGKCDSCHTRHSFSAAEAREPEACGTCHMGPDHEQIDMYEKSKHGVVYGTQRDLPGGDTSLAPTCVTCHMPEGTDAGGKPDGEPLIHDVSTNITLGTVAQGARLAGTLLPVPMRTITATEASVRRHRMEWTCLRCHNLDFVRRNLEGADEIKRDVDDLLWDPVMRIRGLWYDGLLDPMPQNRPPNPLFGQALVLGGQQLYGGTSAVEQLFFTTYKYDHVSTFKGAYHINPDYSHWYGWSRVMQDRDLVKGEESRLRRIALSDPGFAAPARLVVGRPATFDASRLAAWGDASPNTYEWWLGDGSASLPAASALVRHTYAAPGRYTVQLTCADRDLVNDPANPAGCSAKRTTSRAVRVKYGSWLPPVAITRVPADALVILRGTITTGDGGLATVVLLTRTAGGGWKQAASRTVKTAAGKPAAVAFRLLLYRATTLRFSYAGDADTWSAQSAARTVRPL